MPLDDILSASGALILVLLLIVLLRFGARWLAPRAAQAGGSRLTVAAQLGLDARRRLRLVRCDGAQVLILTGGGNDVMLPWPAAAPFSAEIR